MEARLMVTASFRCAPLKLPTAYTAMVITDGPARGDDDPPGVLAFGFGEHHVGDHAIAQDDQQHGPQQLCEKRRHKVDWEAAKLSGRRRLVYTDDHSLNR